MARQKNLTPRELAIMKVVWQAGRVTVRDIHQALSSVSPVAYTTVMTLMGILVAKGHLVRHKEERAYVYVATKPRQQVERGLVREFLNRVFSGEAHPLLLHLVKHEKLTAKERRELRELIEQIKD